jgi:hypothetical protein
MARDVDGEYNEKLIAEFSGALNATISVNRPTKARPDHIDGGLKNLVKGLCLAKVLKRNLYIGIPDYS